LPQQGPEVQPQVQQHVALPQQQASAWISVVVIGGSRFGSGPTYAGADGGDSTGGAAASPSVGSWQ
jgi:hypothetical protein